MHSIPGSRQALGLSQNSCAFCDVLLCVARLGSRSPLFFLARCLLKLQATGRGVPARGSWRICG